MGKFEDPAPARGVYAAILTPRGDDSTDADISVFLDYIDRICRARVNGLVLFGSTGEFVHYDIEDRIRVVSLAVKRSRVPVLVNISHSCLQGAVDLAEHAESAGASGLMLMPPYFYRYDDSEIEEFYRRFLAEAAPGIPVYIYNIPHYTNALSSKLAERLLLSGRFAGIKDSSGSWPWLEEVLRLKEHRAFQALVGSESLLLQTLEAGGDGTVSGLAAVVPELIVGVYEAYRSGNLELQQQLNTRIAELLHWVLQFPGSVAIKCAADVRGWLPSQLAVPLGPAASRRLDEFRSWVSSFLAAMRT
jgi:dihydrodipicolinate synthase/N-acetylneuraminate lyase